MESKKQGELEVAWRVGEGSIVITVGNAPKYRVNVKEVEPGPRQIRDAIVQAVEHALSDQFDLLPSLDNREG